MSRAALPFTPMAVVFDMDGLAGLMASLASRGKRKTMPVLAPVGSRVGAGTVSRVSGANVRVAARGAALSARLPPARALR